ncbi:MAG: DegV family EDD domain-containing protein, partial [Desulfobacterales bacterium]|nr:DegV family EDD domain-containing protein [Desulfobacterales bacterium]
GADAQRDTGRNLVISLSPLRRLNENPEKMIQQLLFSACGNSGNIAARYFSGFLTLNSSKDLCRAAKLGREYAWKAIGNPRPGTMLNVFDALPDLLSSDFRLDQHRIFKIIDHLTKTVWDTSDMIPELKEAGVVDSGALGMFIFFEGFFHRLMENETRFVPVTERFKNGLTVSDSFKSKMTAGYCIDMVIDPDINSQEMVSQIAGYGESMVSMEDKDFVKIHIHARNKEDLRNKVDSLGRIVDWSEEDIGRQVEGFCPQKKRQAIHIMTDAAGSLTRQDSKRLQITLLDSYILTEKNCYPETLMDASQVYLALRKGQKVTTSQASVFERHQHYQSALSRYERVLYLCTGAAFTGNYATAEAWKKANDPEDRFTVIDTGAASGRLAAMVLAVARYAEKADDSQTVIDYAREVAENSHEYVFIDRLQYLAAGGRLSKSSAFFGDMFRVKPIITPQAQGAKKVGTAGNAKGQIRFALEKLSRFDEEKGISFIMLEYSDNRQWVENNVKTKIQQKFPLTEIILQPLSLTSGVHMGPGTWAVAFVTEKK